MKITPYILICWSSLWKPKICRMSHFNVRHVSFFWRRAFSELTSTIRQVIFSMTWSDFVEHKFHRNIFHLSFVPSFFPIRLLISSFAFPKCHIRIYCWTRLLWVESIFGRKFKRYFFHFQWIEKVQKCKIIFWWASFQSPVFFESEIDWICLRDAAIKSDHYLQSALQFSTILSSDYPQSSSGWVVLFFRH